MCAKCAASPVHRRNRVHSDALSNLTNVRGTTLALLAKYEKVIAEEDRVRKALNDERAAALADGLDVGPAPPALGRAADRVAHLAVEEMARQLAGVAVDGIAEEGGAAAMDVVHV